MGATRRGLVSATMRPGARSADGARSHRPRRSRGRSAPASRHQLRWREISPSEPRISSVAQSVPGGLAIVDADRAGDVVLAARVRQPVHERPGTSTELAHIRSHAASKPPKPAAAAAQRWTARPRRSLPANDEPARPAPPPRPRSPLRRESRAVGFTRRARTAAARGSGACAREASASTAPHDRRSRRRAAPTRRTTSTRRASRRPRCRRGAATIPITIAANASVTVPARRTCRAASSRSRVAGRRAARTSTSSAASASSTPATASREYTIARPTSPRQPPARGARPGARAVDERRRPGCRARAPRAARRPWPPRRDRPRTPARRPGRRHRRPEQGEHREHRAHPRGDERAEPAGLVGDAAPALRGRRELKAKAEPVAEPAATMTATAGEERRRSPPRAPVR